MKVSPLRHFPFYHTHDLDLARKMLAEWGITDYAIADQSYQYRINFVTLRDVALTYGCCSSAVRMTFSGVGFMRHRICLSGNGRSNVGRFSADLDPRQWSAIVPSGESGSLDFGAGYEELRMVVDDGIMRRKLGALIGEAPVDRIMFSADNDVRSPGLARYRRMLSFLLSELDAGGPEPPGMVVNEIAEALLVSYLCGQSHNFSRRLLKPDRTPSSLQQRRAEDYIAANWNKPLSIEEIAGASHVSARSIFRSFKDAHGCSPFQYIKRIRLQQARAMLLDREQQSVVSVALKCGFQSLGHFASSYRGLYGELPSNTVRR